MKKILIIVLAVVAIVLMFVGLDSKHVYNNGVCRNCGGQYVAINQTFDKEDGLYITTCQCSDCGKIINVPSGVILK